MLHPGKVDLKELSVVIDGRTAPKRGATDDVSAGHLSASRRFEPAVRVQGVVPSE